MGSHIIDGEFQSDKYPTCPRGKVPLSVKDPTAQDLLWEYAQRRRAVDPEFADDLQTALRAAGYTCAIIAPTAPSCADNSPPWFTGRWRDWHRGHGCDKDDGKPRTTDGAAEIAAGLEKL